MRAFELNTGGLEVPTRTILCLLSTAALAGCHESGDLDAKSRGEVIEGVQPAANLPAFSEHGCEEFSAPTEGAFFSAGEFVWGTVQEIRLVEAPVFANVNGGEEIDFDACSASIEPAFEIVLGDVHGTSAVEGMTITVGTRATANWAHTPEVVDGEMSFIGRPGAFAVGSQVGALVSEDEDLGLITPYETALFEVVRGRVAFQEGSEKCGLYPPQIAGLNVVDVPSRASAARASAIENAPAAAAEFRQRIGADLEQGQRARAFGATLCVPADHEDPAPEEDPETPGGPAF